MISKNYKILILIFLINNKINGMFSHFLDVLKTCCTRGKEIKKKEIKKNNEENKILKIKFNDDDDNDKNNKDQKTLLQIELINQYKKERNFHKKMENKLNSITKIIKEK